MDTPEERVSKVIGGKKWICKQMNDFIALISFKAKNSYNCRIIASEAFQRRQVCVGFHVWTVAGYCLQIFAVMNIFNFPETQRSWF